MGGHVLLETTLWSLGFLLLVCVVLCAAASVIRKDQNAADRILTKRFLKSTDSVDDLAFNAENTVEHG